MSIIPSEDDVRLDNQRPVPDMLELGLANHAPDPHLSVGTLQLHAWSS